MKPSRPKVALAAMAALVLASGCGSIGESLWGVVVKGGKEAIQTATNQAVEKAVNEIESELQLQILQALFERSPAG